MNDILLGAIVFCTAFWGTIMCLYIAGLLR